MKKIITLVILVTSISLVATGCGGSGTAGGDNNNDAGGDNNNDGGTVNLGPEAGSNVLQAKQLSAAATYAIQRFVMMGMQASFMSVSEDALGKGKVTESFAGMAYSGAEHNLVDGVTEDADGTVSGSYTVTATENENNNSVVLDFAGLNYTHSNVLYGSELKITIDDNSFEGIFQITNRLGSDITGSGSGSIEYTVLDEKGGPTFFSIDVVNNAFSTGQLIAFMSERDLDTKDLELEDLTIGAINIDTTNMQMKAELVDQDVVWTLSGVSALVKYYTTLPENDNDLENFAPENNDYEEYSCSNLGATMTQSAAEGTLSFSLNDALHCTCPTCS